MRQPDEDREGQQRIERRINLQGPADEKSSDPEVACGSVFGKQQPGHQEPAQDEEEIDAGPSGNAAEPKGRVFDEHGRHGDRAEDVEGLPANERDTHGGPCPDSARRRAYQAT